MFDIQNYYLATSPRHAMAMIQAHPGARYLAGGTDVLVRLRERHPGYNSLVDIRALDELRGISHLEDGTLRLGAGTPFSQIMASPLIQRCLPMLSEAAASVAGPQIRNVATLGGNLCNGAVSADSAAPVLACNAILRILNMHGERTIPALGFHTGPGQVALRNGDLLLSVDVPRQDWEGFGSHYYKYAMRQAMDIATIGCACAVRLTDNAVADIRLAFAVAAPTPIRCPQAERAALGHSVGDEARNALLDKVAQAVTADVKPRSSWRATAEFRLHIIRTLAQRVLDEALRRAGAQA